jgi:hypothetical protein
MDRDCDGFPPCSLTANRFGESSGSDFEMNKDFDPPRRADIYYRAASRYGFEWIPARIRDAWLAKPHAAIRGTQRAHQTRSV